MILWIVIFMSDGDICSNEHLFYVYCDVSIMFLSSVHRTCSVITDLYFPCIPSYLAHNVLIGQLHASSLFINSIFKYEKWPLIDKFTIVLINKIIFHTSWKFTFHYLKVWYHLLVVIEPLTAGSFVPYIFS